MSQQRATDARSQQRGRHQPHSDIRSHEPEQRLHRASRFVSQFPITCSVRDSSVVYNVQMFTVGLQKLPTALNANSRAFRLVNVRREFKRLIDMLRDAARKTI